jgi:hypothetical protein
MEGKPKHNRSGMVAVLGPFEALPCYIHTYIHMEGKVFWHNVPKFPLEADTEVYIYQCMCAL